MLRMVSYPHRPQSEHMTCYLNRTYHVLPTHPYRDIATVTRRSVNLRDLKWCISVIPLRKLDATLFAGHWMHRGLGTPRPSEGPVFLPEWRPRCFEFTQYPLR